MRSYPKKSTPEVEVCYAYLADVPSKEESPGKPVTRGWTLKELIALFRVVSLGENWKSNQTNKGSSRLLKWASLASTGP
jgi:hypothetical protein